ncbi:MAG: ribbon-helix-helix protein, CopG family [Candidatus Lokiarchaeota archaeon]|nr:ribbon-helix-helix protein, CopG family [Candidatus Lokiarchaeota archaeon]
MKIISLQITDDLLDRFEKVRIESGFASKSEALRDSIIKFIENYEKFDNIEGYRIMTINLVYPFKEPIINEISEINHKFHSIIKAITDWRIAEKKIEIILAVGEFKVINDLYQSIVRIKDVACSVHEVILD